MIKSKEEQNTQHQSYKLNKEQSSWNTIIDNVPNNIPHPKTIALTPSSSASSITNDIYSTKKKNQNKVDNLLKQMETRTKLNITSNEQFPPSKQTLTKELNRKGRNNTSDNSNSIQNFGPQLNNKK